MRWIGCQRNIYNAKVAEVPINVSRSLSIVICKEIPFAFLSAVDA
jgi:hypothetical protein